MFQAVTCPQRNQFGPEAESHITGVRFPPWEISAAVEQGGAVPTDLSLLERWLHPTAVGPYPAGFRSSFTEALRSRGKRLACPQHGMKILP